MHRESYLAKDKVFELMYAGMEMGPVGHSSESECSLTLHSRGNVQLVIRTYIL
jgi:hypothetical protein